MGGEHFPICLAASFGCLANDNYRGEVRIEKSPDISVPSSPQAAFGARTSYTPWHHFPAHIRHLESGLHQGSLAPRSSGSATPPFVSPAWAWERLPAAGISRVTACVGFHSFVTYITISLSVDI